jgi:hypothetical protein
MIISHAGEEEAGGGGHKNRLPSRAGRARYASSLVNPSGDYRPKTCHPDRSEAKWRDLFLLGVMRQKILLGRAAT